MNEVTRKIKNNQTPLNDPTFSDQEKSHVIPAKATTFTSGPSTGDLLREIYPRLDKFSLLSRLNPKKTSTGLSLDCMGCGTSGKAYLYDNSAKIICNKAGCAYAISLWDYVQDAFNLDNQGTLKYLADAAGYQLPAMSEAAVDRAIGNKHRVSILDEAMAYFKENLHKPEGDEVKKYLKETRGYSDELINKMEIGAYVSYIDTIRYLKVKGFDEAQVKDTLGFIESRHDYPLVFAYRDEFGKIQSIWGRTLKADVKNKYLPFSETSKDVPFMFHHARKSGRDFIGVEGYFDTLNAHAHGATNVIGSCGGQFNHEQINLLKEYRANSITLLPDNDENGAGRKSTLKSIESLINEPFALYVINEKLLGACKDLDELIVKHGQNRMVEITESKVSAFEYYANHLIEKYQNDKTALIHECFQFDKKIKQLESWLNLAAQFWPIITHHLGLSKNEINQLLQWQEEESRHTEYIQNAQEHARKTTEIAQSGDTKALEHHLTQTPKPLLKYEHRKIEFIASQSINFLLTAPPNKVQLLGIDYDDGTTEAFLHRGIVGMLAGAGGSGKTHLITQLGFSIATGKQFLNRYTIKEVGAVFIALGENTYDDIHRLFYKHAEHLTAQEKELAATRIAFESFTGRESGFIDKSGPTSAYNHLLDSLKKAEPAGGWKLIVLDPISRFLGSESETDPAEATRFIEILERMSMELKGNPTILFGHHMSKSGANSLEKSSDATAARGSSALVDGVRWVAHLNRTANVSEPDSTQLYDRDYVEFVITKTNFTRYHPEHYLFRDEKGRLSDGDEAYRKLKSDKNDDKKSTSSKKQNIQQIKPDSRSKAAMDDQEKEINPLAGLMKVRT